MEDGPELAEGSYEYNGKTYRLDERESERWRVLDDGVHIGSVIAVSRNETDGVLYTIEVRGDSGPQPDLTDDWARAIETLIDIATF